jgi:hypothetical protein
VSRSGEFQMSAVRAWLQVDGRRVDLHYRDLDDVEHWLAEAHVGRFRPPAPGPLPAHPRQRRS